jgi:hypothetical protein
VARDGDGDDEKKRRERSHPGMLEASGVAPVSRAKNECDVGAVRNAWRGGRQAAHAECRRGGRLEAAHRGSTCDPPR